MNASERPVTVIFQRACEGGSCVEVALGGDGVMVRDSKDPAGPVLSFTMQEWVEFLYGVRMGMFDPH
jgi:uncharacterized protein DUF397